MKAKPSPQSQAPSQMQCLLSISRTFPCFYERDMYVYKYIMNDIETH